MQSAEEGAAAPLLSAEVDAGEVARPAIARERLDLAGVLQGVDVLFQRRASPCRPA